MFPAYNFFLTINRTIDVASSMDRINQENSGTEGVGVGAVEDEATTKLILELVSMK